MIPFRRLRLSLLIWLCLPLTYILASPTATADPTATAALEASGFDGAICLYDLQTETYRAAHAERIDEVFIPASTFKIFSALVALETGVIADRDTIITWDGTWRKRTELNRDLDLQSAFRLSAVPHFQELVRRIGPARMQRYIDDADYGNRDISGGEDTFWLTGALRISPRQQVDFLARLYANQLPFTQETMDAVKAMMLVDENPDHILRAKTGWATLEDNQHTGWWVGWIERGPEVTVFATVLMDGWIIAI